MSTTCVAALPDAKSAVYALVVKGEGENLSSTIHRVTDFTAGDEVLYKVKRWLTGLWLSPKGHLYAVDSGGMLHANSSGKWQVTDLNCRSGLTWIWGLDDNTIFACGKAGAIVRLRAAQWESFNENVDGDLYGLHGTAPTDLYAVGEAGRIFRSDGTRWQRVPAPTNHILNAVYCRSKDKAYVCGEGGMLFEGAGTKWTRIEDIDRDLYALTVFKNKLYLGAGDNGLYAYDGKTVDLVKDNIFSYGLGSSSKYLTAAGGDETARYDGVKWEAIGYS
jgi:photosystem II stability/assembly factor-like uncharacterized protein